MCCRSIHGIGWPRRSPDAGDGDQDDDDDDDRRLARGTVISDKDDQASSCSGQNFWAEQEEITCKVANAASRPPRLGLGHTREAPLPAFAFVLFCLLPFALFQRLNMLIYIYIYISLIFISPSRPSPPHRVHRHASHHFRLSSLGAATEKWAVESCVEDRLKASSHQPLDPHLGPGQSHQSNRMQTPLQA